MLEKLDDIPWAQLGHAYGEASDVPPLLRALSSTNRQQREEAWYALYGNLYHQGTVYEATAYAVPFLLELAQAAEVEDRHEILVYLSTLSVGTSYLDVHQHLGIFADEKAKPDFNERLQQELAHVRAAHEAVRAGAPVYARLLTDRSPQVRAAAAHLLSLGKQDAVRNNGWLRAHFAGSETDEMVLTACVLAAGSLAEDDQAAIDWLTVILARDTRRGVRLAAAIGLCRALRTTVPEQAVSVVVEGLSTPGTETDIFAQLPWPGADLETQCGSALSHAGSAAIEALPVLAATMERVNTWRAYDIASMMLFIAFEGRAAPEGTAFADLNAAEQAAVRAIAESQTFWRGFNEKSIIVNALDVLREYGLPDMPSALRAYVAG